MEFCVIMRLSWSKCHENYIRNSEEIWFELWDWNVHDFGAVFDFAWFLLSFCIQIPEEFLRRSKVQHEFNMCVCVWTDQPNNLQFIFYFGTVKDILSIIWLTELLININWEFRARVSVYFWSINSELLSCIWASL